MGNKSKKSNQISDYLSPLLKEGPASWALIRANEIRSLERVKFKHPILDVGCGNGLVAKVILSKRGEKFDWGIDLSSREVGYAKKSGCYRKCKVASVYNLPFDDQQFEMVFSNSVIEHIQDLDKALREISRVLKKRGLLVITVPSSFITRYLIEVELLNKLRLDFLANLSGKLFNYSFKHYHLHTSREWRMILKKHSFILESYYYYHTPEMIKVHQLLSILAFPSQVVKVIFGRWILFPKLRQVLVVPWLKRMLWRFYIADSKKDEGGSLLLVARKIN